MSDSSLIEKRQKPRFFANFPVTIKATDDTQEDSKPLHGRTSNISESGLGLIIPDQLPSSSTYELTLNLEPFYANLDIKIAFRWQHHQILEGYNECGVSIVELSDQSQGVLRDLINNVLIKNN